MRSYGNGQSNFNKYHALAQGLGWFSIGLGLLEILAPRKISRSLGMRVNPTLLRLLGLREVLSGINILTRTRQPAAAVESRVLGDAIDLALLGGAMASPGNNRARLAGATAAVAGVTALDTFCAMKLHSAPPKSTVIKIQKSLIISATADVLYRHWRNFEQLPRIMNHLESVHVTGDRTSHWVAKAPAGTRVEWDAEILEDRPEEVIAWHSSEGSMIKNRGTVRFERATGNRGTLLRVELEYEPPGGRAAAQLAKLLGEEPEKQLSVDLLRFKQFIETGEMARTEGQPAG